MIALHALHAAREALFNLAHAALGPAAPTQDNRVAPMAASVAQVPVIAQDDDEPQSWMDVATAPYFPPPIVSSPPPPPTTNKKVALDPRVIWDRKPTNRSDNSDNNGGQHPDSLLDNDFSADVLNQSLYTPHGRWAWAAGLPIVNPKTLMDLGAGAMCTATLNTGLIGSRQVTYISRSWKMIERRRWRGVYSELALYKSQYYMKPFQGNIIPAIIGVHIDPRHLTIAMEPPHRSFWIEASPDMPTVLKELVVIAFRSIHDRGVLHGDVELRHILIGGDCAVTVIDFGESRARQPYPDVNLRMAEPEEFEMEIRMLKFKLDYKGAREREHAKWARVRECYRKNELRRQKLAEKERGSYDGPIEPEESLILEDIINPVPHPQTWAEQWLRPPCTPRRFVVPGQTTAQLKKTVGRFLDLLGRMQEVYEANPTLFVSSTDKLTSGHLARKRSASMTPDISDAPSKRRRREPLGDDDSDEHPDLAHTAVHSTTPRTSPVPCPPYQASSKTYDCCDSGDLLPASTTPSKPSKPPKIRDFAYESYDGPRGFYVPHPPTENRMGVERAWYIRQENSTKCREHGLPYYEGDSHRVIPPSYKRYVKRGNHIAEGALKRRIMHADDPDWMEDRERIHVRKKRKGKRAASGSDDEPTDLIFMQGEDFLDLGRGRSKIARYRDTASSSAVPHAPHRGILRKVANNKAISYSKTYWTDETDLQLSPKLGPAPLFVTDTETRPLLGSKVNDLLPRSRVYSDEDEPIGTDTKTETVTTLTKQDGPIDNAEASTSNVASGMTIPKSADATPLSGFRDAAESRRPPHSPASGSSSEAVGCPPDRLPHDMKCAQMPRQDVPLPPPVVLQRPSDDEDDEAEERAVEALLLRDDEDTDRE